MKAIVLSGLLSLSAFSAEAASFSFTGNFSGDADVLSFVFRVGATSNVTLRSYSYAGGTMADGTVVPAGGFDPILALWDSAGDLIREYDDGPGPVPADPVTGRHYDSNLVISDLVAGTYTATVAQYDNFARGDRLELGFSKSSPTFTSAFGCSNGQFCDVAGSNRTSFWAFDVLGVEEAVVNPDDPAPVPLPATAPLVLAGLAGLGFLRRRSA